MTDDVEAPACNPVPMAEWLRDTGVGCKPCYLAPAARWYADKLREFGHTERADQLIDAVETALTGDDPVPAGRELDKVKQDFPNLLSELREFDCAVQEVYHGEESD